MSDLITVIIPVYNVSDYISRTINSVLCQTYKDWELILVDDGSTDDSGDICEAYSATDERIKVIHQKNGGVSSARNMGIELSSGKYIAFIDGDDYISEYYLETLYNMLVNNDADMSVQIYYNMYPTGREKSVKENINKIMPAWEFIEFEILDGRDTSPCVKLYKSDIIKKHNIRFDENITNLEDMLFLFNYLQVGKSVCYDTGMVNYYRIIRTDGVVFSKFSEHKLTALDARKKVRDELLKLGDDRLIIKQTYREMQDAIWFLVLMHRDNYHGKHIKMLRKYLKNRMMYLLKNKALSIKMAIKLLVVFVSPGMYLFLLRRK